MSDDSSSNRDRVIHVRVSEAEFALLEAAAGQLPVSAAMRLLALRASQSGAPLSVVHACSPARWVAFLEIFPDGVESLSGVIADPAVLQAVGRRGAYLVGRFPAPPSGMPDVMDSALAYAGETHGRTASLRSRLLQFGRSAGLFPGGRRDGHYSAYDFCDGPGRPVPVSEVYIALFPVPESIPNVGDLHGMWPLFAEASLLWQRVSGSTSCRLPPLNNEGAQGPDTRDVAQAYVRAWDQLRDLTDVTTLFGENLTVRGAAAKRLLVALASGVWGYGQRRVHLADEAGGRYAACHIAGGAWLYLGWTADNRAYVSIWGGDACEFGAAPGQEAAPDPEGFEALVRNLLTTYI